jgi:HrpA-like RNA helicase
LDKLVLRIKLLHEGEGSELFRDPGEVLGSAIQPPLLRNIDSAIRSLQFCGGLELKGEDFVLTNLGRLYVDLPIDITYCKLLVLSRLFGTYDDILILVSVLSQSKSPVRRHTIEKNSLKYLQAVDNPESCDFLSLVSLYRRTESARKNRRQM